MRIALRSPTSRKRSSARFFTIPPRGCIGLADAGSSARQTGRPLLVFLLPIHLLAALFWVGGMAFAHFILRPAAMPLDPPMRLPLWRRVFERFLPWAGISAIALLLSGIAMVVTDFGGFKDAALYVSLMMSIGIVM